MHGRQRRAFELRPAHEQLRQGPALTVVQVGGRGRRYRVDRNGPEIVRLRTRGHIDLARQPRLQKIQVALDRGIDHAPLALQVLDVVRLNLACARVGKHAAHVGFGALADDPGRSAGDILGDQRGRVAAARVEPIEDLAVTCVTHRRRGLRILQAHAAEWIFFDVAVSDVEEIVAAVRTRLDGQTQLEIVIGNEFGEITGVFQHFGELAGAEIQTVNIVPARIALVHSDQNAAFDVLARADDLDSGLVERRQTALLPVSHVDAV